ncbi:histidine phosphatase family protein, partial [Pleionea mediterranea]
FYLARHGETEWNRIKRLQGRLDSPLTEQGIQQANDLAASMTNYSVDAVITSPLLRARRTAEICQQQLNVPFLLMIFCRNVILVTGNNNCLMT